MLVLCSYVSLMMVNKCQNMWDSPSLCITCNFSYHVRMLACIMFCIGIILKIEGCGVGSSYILVNMYSGIMSFSSMPYYSALKVEAAHLSEISVHFYWTAWCHAPRKRILLLSYSYLFSRYSLQLCCTFVMS